MSDLGKQLIARLTELKPLRQLHESTWSQCYKFAAPHRGQLFRNGTHSTAQQLTDDRADIGDSAPAQAASDMAAGLVSGMTPSNSQWFELDTPSSEDFAGKQWLGAAGKTIWQNITASNFDSCALDAMLDYVAGGYFVMMVNEADGGGYDFEVYDASECYLAASSKARAVDTLYRPYKLSVARIRDEFGEDALTPKMRDAWDKKEFNKTFELLHAVYPRALHGASPFVKDLPFASVHCCTASGQVLRESGYHEQPFAAPRGYVLGGSDYALGPFHLVLGDSKQLQKLWTWETDAAAVAIGGMWKATDDGVLNPRAVRIGPNKVVAVADINNLVPLESGARFDVAYEQKQELRNQIRATLMADVLKTNDAPTMTATEVHVRVQLVRQRFGPQLGRLTSEWLQTIVSRCFGLAMRAGALSAPPPSLDNTVATVRYTSPLARAQRLEEVSALDQLIERVTSIVGLTQDTAVLDNIDERAAVEAYANGLGVPPSVLRSAEDVQAMRENRAAQQQQAQQQAQGAELQTKLMEKAA